MIRFTLFVVVIFIFCIPFKGRAEVRQNPEKLYGAGVTAFVKHDFNKASRLLEEAIKIGLPEPYLKDARDMLRLIKFDNADAIIVGKYKIATKDFLDVFNEKCIRFKNDNDYANNFKEVYGKKNLKESILNSMINEKVMLIAAEDIGLSVTENEIEYAITHNPAFMKDNQFNKKVYLRTLELNRSTPEKYKYNIMVQLTQNKLQLNLKKDIAIFIEDYKKNISITINKALVEDVSCLP